MKLKTLIIKEIRESVSTGKIIWLPVVFLLLGVMEPITTYYMPQILEVAGDIPKEVVEMIPTPTSEEVLLSVLSQFGLLGTALLVLSSMGSVSNERGNGALTLVMVRPISALQYLGSKWISQCFIAVGSFGLGYTLAYYYTVLLFGDIAFSTFLLSLFVYCLWVIFVISVTLVCSVCLKQNGGVAAVSLAVLAGLSVFSSFLPNYAKWSPSMVPQEIGTFFLSGTWSDTAFIAFSSSIGIVIALFVFAFVAFKRYEAY
ncbi:ABC transporter permease [Alkalihalobacterium bogoriense]|uniref:ABC transporter permease n=1 Tax=Alkalihalobacterium bogoriense TaxID=246272 RepID=UPI000552F514|nr:ABC transporter permease subunit [Alkalihalobacterium bogoriense]